MGSIHTRRDKLVLDFKYKGQRCREQTKLDDTPANRKRLKGILERVEAEVLLGTFDYATYFPNSKKVDSIRQLDLKREAVLTDCPTITAFYAVWWNENEVRWRKSYKKTMQQRFDTHIFPKFGDRVLSSVTRPELLEFRAELCRLGGRRGTMANVTVNKIMQAFKNVLDEGAVRFGYTSPYVGIKSLKKERFDVSPFTVEEVKLILDMVREDFQPYYTARFFTGMRTNEIDGLQWKYVDFKDRKIIVREGLVLGEMTTLKTDGSAREIDMTSLVYEALKEQFERTGKMRYVFCSPEGYPLNHNNVTKRVWKPLLRLLGLEYRRPYETRHTAATLWLASGEAPEYIARQMGHTTTEMLFRVYSRYVPNLTRQDGSAFEKLINTQMTLDKNN